MENQQNEIDLEFARNITNDKVAWYDIYKTLMELDQNDPKIVRLKEMLKYIDKCDVYQDLWNRRRNMISSPKMVQANLQQDIAKRESEKTPTKSGEEPPLKKPKKNSQATPKKILGTQKSSLALKEAAKIVDTAWKGTWPYIFIKSRELIYCCELKNAILLSPGTFAVPCFVTKCSGGSILQLRDLSVLKAGKFSDVWRKKEMAEMLVNVKNDDFCKFAITECTEHSCGISFSIEQIREIKIDTTVKLKSLRQKAGWKYKKAIEHETTSSIGMLHEEDDDMPELIPDVSENSVIEKKTIPQADVKIEVD
ncbi:unnamed protein product [Oikopleura dioica]|uniref:Uncharacterized protein n=1 Tax=Oikopleura dioica TaxID=34765 RepID=E4WWP5_OIKDI|nr:unnamed protein product [Oikopleura dioica]